MADKKGEKVNIYRFHISLDPAKNGILCEIKADRGAVLGDITRRAVDELLETHRELLPDTTKNSPSSWVFLHGELGVDIERLDPARTFHDLAVFPEETIHMGPSWCFEKWLRYPERSKG